MCSHPTSSVPGRRMPNSPPPGAGGPPPPPALGRAREEPAPPAADACDEVAVADARSEHVCDGAQNLVAEGVPEAVVRLLEVVYVEHDDRDRRSRRRQSVRA